MKFPNILGALARGLRLARAAIPAIGRRGLKPLSVRETVGLPDPDFFLAGHQFFRRSGGRTTRLIHDAERIRAQQRGFEEWRQNPLANRILAMKADFIIGGGMIPTSKNKELDDFLKDHWNDLINQWPRKLHALAVGYRRDGELVNEPVVNPITGRTRFLWNDPSIVTDVIAHGKFYTEPSRVQLFSAYGGEQAYIIAPGEPELTWEQIRASGQKAIMFFRANETIGYLRGLGDLHHSWEYIQALDNTAFAMLERVLVAITYLWVLKGRTLGPNEADEILTTLRTGKPGDTIWLRGDAELQALFPDLKAADFSEMFRTVKNLVLGGAGIPEAWFAEGDSATRATLAEQGTPTFRAMTRAQGEFLEVINTCLAFAIDRAAEAALISAEAAAAEWAVTADPVNTRDDARMIDALTKMPTVLDYAVDVLGGMTRKEAAVIYRSMIAQVADVPEELPAEIEAAFAAPARPSTANADGTKNETAAAEMVDTVRGIFKRYLGKAA